MENCIRNIGEQAKKCAERMTQQVVQGAFQEHIISNAAVPYSGKQEIYAQSFIRFIKSKNFGYVRDCRGTSDDQH